MINKHPFLLDVPAQKRHQNVIFNPGNSSYDTWAKKEKILAHNRALTDHHHIDGFWDSYNEIKKVCRRQYFSITGENCAVTGCGRSSVKDGKYIQKLTGFKE